MSFDIHSVSIEKIIAIIQSVSETYLTSEDAQNITVKGDANFVTKVDMNIESAMKKHLGNLYPEIQFMGEEEDNSDVDFSKPFWILDPVDGTSNLIHDYRNSSMSLALAIDQEVVLGFIYHFYTREIFFAVKGSGAYSAFLEKEPLSKSIEMKKPLHVSSITELSRSLATIGTSPYDKATLGEENMKTIKTIFFHCEDIRRTGSAAIDLANIAAGRTDIFLERNLKPWDFAAGIIIIEEAGGVISTYDGKKIDITKPSDILAGNPIIHNQIKQLI